jgi:hypothetical protein
MEPCAAHHVFCMRGMGKHVVSVPAPASVMEVHHMITSIISLFESAEFAKRVLGEMARIGCKGICLRQAATVKTSMEIGWQESRERLRRSACTQWYVPRGFIRDR